MSSVTKLKQNLEDINKNTIDKGLEDNFYTQYIQMHNSLNNETSVVTLT